MLWFIILVVVLSIFIYSKRYSFFKQMTYKNKKSDLKSGNILIFRCYKNPNFLFDDHTLCYLTLNNDRLNIQSIKGNIFGSIPYTDISEIWLYANTKFLSEIDLPDKISKIDALNIFFSYNNTDLELYCTTNDDFAEFNNFSLSQTNFFEHLKEIGFSNINLKENNRIMSLSPTVIRE